MEDGVEWHDPLLITDASSSQQQQLLNSHTHYNLIKSSSSSTYLNMADHDDFSPNELEDVSWHDQSLEATTNNNYSDPIAKNAVDGREMLGFSLASPDLVICAGSPDIPQRSYEDSPEFWKGSSIEVSLENGIKGPEMKDSCEPSAAAKFFTNLQAPREEDICQEPHFELPQPPLIVEESLNDSLSPLSINAGSMDGINFVGKMQFSVDQCFSGGDTVNTDSSIGGIEGLSIYRTARFGNFVYHFKNIESGFYMIDLHFAEIVFTDGPPGMRVFDVFIQEEKVVSSLDIYASVGANSPLVISDIKTEVKGEEGLLIRFEGIVGTPIVSGISVKKDFASTGELKTLEMLGTSHASECNLLKTDLHDGKVDGEFQWLQEEHGNQKIELRETKRALEVLKKENELKNRECQEAWSSLKELQNELMRKSMHVGSLAFAIEGQVKEKSRWFSSLRDLTRKLKILKMDHIKLSDEALTYKKCLEDMTNMNSIIQSKLKEYVELHEELKTKFIRGAKERKDLYNKVLELKGNIRVFCRCRPLNIEEIAAGESMAVDFEAAKDGELTVKSNGIAKKTFKFEAVFSPQADQVDIFEETAPLATSVLDGYNVCIFAYGQTGTGKTFTMEGTDEARGVNYRTLDELFRVIEERKNTYSYEISVSVLEVYNEQIRDLLSSESQPGVPSKRLEVKQVGEGIHHVPGLVEARVNNVNEVWEVLQTGSNARAVGSTNANEHSSRSHCIHCVMVKGENLLNGECTRSKLWLIDLAGSERIAKTEVQGERLRETQNINRSLSALGDVISALATKSPHIPFRNSKLTHLLQDSLGGDSKTLMFVQISPNENDLSETLCSLNFASRVRGIELGPAKKQVDSTELVKYKQMVEKIKQDMKNKDFQLKKMEDTIHGLDMKIKEKDMKNRNLQDKIKELESQLLVERKLARQHVDTKMAEQQQLQHTSQQLQEQSSTLTRPPLATRAIGPLKTSNESKEQVNLTRPHTENNYYKLPVVPPSVDGFVKRNDLAEKENNPEMAEQLQLPKQIGRASICTTAQRMNPDMAEQPLMPKRTGRASLCPPAHKIPAQAPRRISLLPLPSSVGAARLPSSLLPLTPIQADKKEEEDGGEAECLPEPAHVDSPKELKVGSSKKPSGILRRSLQKRMHMRSPMPQNMRRVGVNVGMEKVRISIGSRGRMAHRVLSSARRATRETPQKQSQREKERGWNTGTAVRTGL